MNYRAAGMGWNLEVTGQRNCSTIKSHVLCICQKREKMQKKPHPTVKHYGCRQRQLIQGFVRILLPLGTKSVNVSSKPFLGHLTVGNIHPLTRKLSTVSRCASFPKCHRYLLSSCWCFTSTIVNVNQTTEKTKMSLLFPLAVLSKAGHHLVVQLHGLKKNTNTLRSWYAAPQLWTQWGRISLSAWQHMSKSERGGLQHCQHVQ